MWLGLGMKETFMEWKAWVKRRVVQVIIINAAFSTINAAPPPVLVSISTTISLSTMHMREEAVSLHFIEINFLPRSLFQRRKDRKQAVRQAWHDYKVANAGLVVAEQETNKWEELWDEYNDVPYWVHRCCLCSRFTIQSI